MNNLILINSSKVLKDKDKPFRIIKHSVSLCAERVTFNNLSKFSLFVHCSYFECMNIQINRFGKGMIFHLKKCGSKIFHSDLNLKKGKTPG